MLDFFDAEIDRMNPRSAASPRKCLNRLRQFAETRRKPIGFHDVTPELVADFRSHLAAAGLRPTVIADYSQRFRALYRRAVRQGLAPVATEAFREVEKIAPKAQAAPPPPAQAVTEERLRWYALKLAPGVEADDPRLSHLDPYNPSVEIARRVGSRMSLQARSAIRGVLFVRATPSRALRLSGEVRPLAHFYTVDRTPAIIPDGEMYRFKRTIGLLSQSMEFLPLNRAGWQAGRNVRITDGPLAGYEGMILDVRDASGNLLRDIPVSLVSTFGFTVRAVIPDIYLHPLA